VTNLQVICGQARQCTGPSEPMIEQTVEAFVASGRERHNRRAERSRFLEKSIGIE
jgi:hypothetical protein